MEPLTARQLRGGTVYPTIRVPSHPGKLLMGVFDDAGAYVADTVLNRRAGEKGAPVPLGLLPEPVPAAEPEAIYAGPLYFHFGHFLLESLARSWYAQRYPELPFVWAGSHTWQGFSLKPWQIEILDILGITNPTRILADPNRFDVVHIPDIGYRYDDTFHPEHAAFLGRYEGPGQQAGSRLWLSRNKLATNWRDLNAAPTERRLAAAGWTLVNPEQLTIHQQLDHLARAEVIAGEEGSAFHLIMLLRDVSSKRFEILRRHGPEHRNLHTIGDARHVNQVFHTLQSERVLEAKGREVSKINPSSSEILDVLGVPVPARPADTVADPAVDDAVAHALGELADGRLLTVGHTHLSPAARAGVAVSTRFAFDPRSYAEDKVRFFEIDLARYVATFHEEQERFDVLWIEAAAVEDFMRDFDLSKPLAAAGAVWIFGTGPLASRAALAVQLEHPGYAVAPQLIRKTSVLTVRRELGEPKDLADVAALSDRQVARRLRRATLRSLRLSRPKRILLKRTRRKGSAAS